MAIKYNFDLAQLSHNELIELQSEIFLKLKELIEDTSLKKGQRILIGNKYAGKEPFYHKEYIGEHLLELDEYKDIVGEYGYIDSTELDVYSYDEDGNEIPSIDITLERDNHKKNKRIYCIHPDDAIVVE